MKVSHRAAPLSVFAAIVLHEILSTIQPELEQRAAHRAYNNDVRDDKHGSLGFILGYVDDVYCILHHDDVEYFLQCFEDLANPLGAILSKEKTLIMTTITCESLIPRLMKQLMAAVALKNAIATYSTKK
jgi:hypothetical protein